MVKPRKTSAWLLVCILGGLFVLSMTSPGWWVSTSERVPEPILADEAQADSLPIGNQKPVAETRPKFVSPASAQGPSEAPALVSSGSRLSNDGWGDDDAPSPPAFRSLPMTFVAPKGLNPLGESKKLVVGSGVVILPAPSEQESSPEPAAEKKEAQKVSEKPATPSDSDATVVAAKPELVTPAGKVGAEKAETPEPTKRKSASDEPAAPLPESVRRLPIAVANIPATIQAVPREQRKPQNEITYPSTEESSASTESSIPRQRPVSQRIDDGWREPETLLESLRGLTVLGPTSKFATEVIHWIKRLGPTMAGGSDESVAILETLAKLDSQTPELAKTIQDRTLARRLRKVGYALGRRLDVWQEVVRLGVPQPFDALPERDPEKLAVCLTNLDSLMGKSNEGEAWRDYLLVEELQDACKQKAAADQLAMQQLARQVLVRLSQTPMTSRQQTFVASEQIVAFRSEMRRWAAEPIGAASVLHDIETYEKTGLPSDARRLAVDSQNLGVSPIEVRRRLADRVDLHYRNANVRIAVTEELINKLIPERNLEYSEVDDTVQGLPVRGQSLMATEVSVRLLPDPDRVRMALEVRGEIVSATTANAGAARFHNDSETRYVARKPLEIDMKGVSVWPTEVGVENQTTLNGVETPLDNIPLVGAMARGLAKTQSDQAKPAANQEVKQKVAAQAKQRLDAEARQRLSEFVESMNQRVFDPLNALSLDPQMISAETQEKRFTMRLRLAGEDQLGSHTPRPQAPADSLLSVQLHESAINNAIQRLQLDGRTFTLPELSKHISTRLSRPLSWEINPEHADVQITFAAKDAIVVRCLDNQLSLTLSVLQLSKSPRKWKNFQIRAFYRPEVNGRSAQLVRDGVIHLIGRLNTSSQIALRGIFSRALSKNNVWDLVPAKIVNEPKLADAAITQFIIDDGWVGVSLGPKPIPSTARRPRPQTR